MGKEDKKDDKESKHDSWSRDFDPSLAVRLIKATTPPLSWDDYVAERSVKSQLQNICSRALGSGSSGSIFSKLLRKIRIKTRGTSSIPTNNAQRVILLHGPPGCGKTRAVRVMASVLAKQKVQVYHIDLTSLKSTWYGQTEHQLKQVLNHLDTLSNAIVFIDEIDSFVGVAGRMDIRRGPLLTDFLQWINGVETTGNNLTLMCATNFIDACDAAFLSRCTLKIEIPPPSQPLRLEWWNSKAKHLAAKERQKLSFCEAESFRCLEQLVNEAEESAAYNFQSAPYYADYRSRLDKLERSTPSKRSSGPTIAGMTRDGHLTTFQQHYPANITSGMVDPQLVANILDQAKTIAASTAAMTVAALNKDAYLATQARPECATDGECIPSNNTSRTTSLNSSDSDLGSPGLFNKLFDNAPFNSFNRPEEVTVDFEESSTYMDTFMDPEPAVVSPTSVEDTAYADETLELLKSRLDKLESGFSSNNDGAKLVREHMEEELSNVRKELEELREWDSVEVTWPIKLESLDKRMYSESFYVAQYKMRLMSAKRSDTAIGFFITHCSGQAGSNYAAIKIGGSTISVAGRSASHTLTKTYPANAAITEKESGKGWVDFLAIPGLKEKYAQDGKLIVTATVRVRRPRKIHLKAEPPLQTINEFLKIHTKSKKTNSNEDAETKLFPF